MADTLAWVPTLNPAKADIPSGYGLNWYGPTIINQTGGALFQQVCASWAQLFSHGPEQLKLHGPFSWEWSFDEEEHVISMEQLGTFGDYERLEVERDWLVQTLTTLAQFGEQASRGGSFLPSYWDVAGALPDPQLLIILGRRTKGKMMKIR